MKFMKQITKLNVLRFFASLFLALSNLTAHNSLAAQQSNFISVGDTIVIEADFQTIDLGTNISEFKGNVVVTSGETVIKAPRGKVLMDADAKPTKARFEGGTTVTRGKDTIKAPTLVFDFKQEAFSATGGVTTLVHPEGQQPVRIQSSTQQYLKSRNQMLASGNVTIKSQDADATADDALLVLGPDNSAERITFTGNVHLQQEGSTVRAAKVVLMPNDDVYMAEGNAYTQVKQEGGSTVVLRSKYQQLDRRKGLLIASGLVDLDYENYHANGPKATFYLTPGDKMDLKKAVFSGRSTLREGNLKQVTADVIEITTNPTYFDARGNVKTRIVTEQKADESEPAKNNSASSASSAPKKQASGKVVAEEDEFNIDAFKLDGLEDEGA